MPSCPPGSLTVDAALRVVLANAPLLEAEERAAFDAMGATLAEPVVAPHPHPPFAASIKDGYALRSIDGAGDFDVVDECRAGALPQVSLGERQAVYITTGAPLPAGADCVVQLESVEALEPALEPAAPARRIRVRRAPRAGLEVRPPGFDIAEGSTLLRAGDVLGAAELGLLGYAGAPAVQVRRAARVAVLSTGDELLDPLAPAAHGAAHGLRGGCVFDSNRPALLAARTLALTVTLTVAVNRNRNRNPNPNPNPNPNRTPRRCWRRCWRRGADPSTSAWRGTARRRSRRRSMRRSARTTLVRVRVRVRVS